MHVDICFQRNVIICTHKEIKLGSPKWVIRFLESLQMALETSIVLRHGLVVTCAHLCTYQHGLRTECTTVQAIVTRKRVLVHWPCKGTVLMITTKYRYKQVRHVSGQLSTEFSTKCFIILHEHKQQMNTLHSSCLDM